MKKVVVWAAVGNLLIASSVFASGYRIPEQSIDGTAKSGANVASASHADAAYHNPANMSWLEDAAQVELDFTYIHLTSIDYDDHRLAANDSSSEKEHFLVPTIFAVSPEYNGFRLGYSLTGSYGLAKRWHDPFARKFSQKFGLKTFDSNPVLSYKINDIFSVAAGVRMIYSQAEAVMNAMPDAYLEIDADAIDWGWNAAVSVKPNDNANISLTYRSNIEMNLDGDTTMKAKGGGVIMHPQGETTSFPAPATLSLSGSYTFDRLTVELNLDRTFWSKYESMDITFSEADGLWSGIFSFPRRKNWDDSNAYRLGLDYAVNEQVNIMAGFAYDENPVPDQTIDFVLPDSDAFLFSLGTRVKISDNMEVGLAALYDQKQSRDVKEPIINGEFTNASAFLAIAGFQYTF